MIQTKQLLIFTFVFLFAATIVIALPGQPMPLRGSVTVNGQPAPNGMFITAKINGAVNAVTTTKNGQYGVPINFKIQDPAGDNSGRTVDLFVEDIKAGSVTFAGGVPTKIDLSINCDDCIPEPAPTPSGSSGGGSGGGGGGGGFIPPRTTNTQSLGPQQQTVGGTNGTTVQTNTCTPEWRCSEWTECQNGVRKRVCVDKYDCGTNDAITQEKCELTDQELYEGPQQSFFSVITGAVTGGGVGTIVTLFVLLGIIAACFTYVYAKRK